jgi:hypothetical protein
MGGDSVLWPRLSRLDQFQNTLFQGRSYIQRIAAAVIAKDKGLVIAVNTTALHRQRPKVPKFLPSYLPARFSTRAE